MESLLELRILSGVQAGARLTIKESLTIGNSGDCDVMLFDLKDLNVTAHVSILNIATYKSNFETHEWQLTTLKNKDGTIEEEKSTFKLGEQVYLSKTVLTVSFKDTAWQIVESVKPSVSEQEKNVDFINSALKPDNQNDNSNLSVKNEIFLDHSKNKTQLFAKPIFSNSWIKILISSVILLFFLVTVLLLFRQTPKNVEVDKPKINLLNNSKNEINQILKSENLLTQVYVTQAADSQLIVNGWVENVDQYNSLAKALSRISPLPKLAISINETILNKAKEIVKTFNQYISITYYKNGKLDLKGAIANKEMKQNLLLSLNNNLPGLVIFSNQLLLFDEVAAYLEASIKNAHIGQASVKWDQNKLIVKFNKINDVAKFDNLINVFKETYGSSLPILGQTANGVLLIDQNSTKPPFVIRSVVSGELPYIIADSGEKILIGGNYHGFVLSKISDNEIILDGPNKIILAR